MTIKQCTCGKKVTTRNCKMLGRDESREMLFFNCTHCASTLIIRKRRKQRIPA